MRRRDSTLDCTTGNVTQVRQFLANGDAATTDLVYSSNGNLLRVTGPTNRNGQRYQLDYQYDPTVQTFRTGISDSFGFTSSAGYNLKYGVVNLNSDLNNQRTSYTYDLFGRVSTITGPYDQGGSTPTLRFEYHPNDATPWALTKHFDVYRDPTGVDTIDVALFTDGLKRVLQTKKDGTVFTGRSGAPQDVMVVSG